MNRWHGEMSGTGMSELSWKTILAQRLPLLGHRNWVGVVDSAYPAQSVPAIELVATGASHLAVLKQVLGAIRGAPHVRPLARVDRELSALTETMAPGIESLREKMNRLLGPAEVAIIPHEQLIKRIDAAGRAFRVLLFKSTLSLPYTSVFFELDCGYWSEASERALRQSFSRKS
jgi:hypothetical protein